MKIILLVISIILVGCSKVLPPEPQLEYETEIVAIEYNRSIVFEGRAKVIESDSKISIIAESQGKRIEMRFSPENTLDKYNLGLYQDENGNIFSTKLWFERENTSNIAIGFKQGNYFEFCGMDINEIPICISGFIGEKIKN
jgi:hypothetical protein